MLDRQALGQSLEVVQPLGPQLPGLQTASTPGRDD